MDKILQKTRGFINKHKLIQNGDRIIAAVSGGADSVCMLNILNCLKNEYNIEIAVAHVNHNLRGQSAENDYLFTKQLAENMKFEFFYLSADVKDYALKNHISYEEAGRKLRYDFFAKLAVENQFTKIATAHNKNDNAETVLMNILRGSTMKGMAGIPPVRSNIIRPILNLTRSEIELFCSNINYVTDQTNFEPIYKRNKIRLSLLPILENEYNSNIIETITHNAYIISDENEYIDSCAKDAYANVVQEKDNTYTLDIKAFLTYHIAIKRRLIHYILEKKADSKCISSVHVDAVISLADKSVTGRCLHLPDGIKAEISYNDLIITKNKVTAGKVNQKVVLGKEFTVNNTSLLLEPTKTIISAENVYYCDSDKTGEELYIRTRRQGDKFYPVGMTGSKKLSDYFIDNKIPKADRESQLILTNANDDIICLIGRTMDRNFICTENTKNFFKIQYIKHGGHDG